MHNKCFGRHFAYAVFVAVGTVVLLGLPDAGLAQGSNSSVSQSPESTNVSPGKDRLLCTDGTVVEGKIVRESPDEITILTRRGQFTYQRVDVRQVIREVPPAKPTPTPVPTPFININSVLPLGPIDPDNPPKLPPLHGNAVRMVKQHFQSLSTAATTQSINAAVPATPAPAASPSPSQTPQI